MEERWVSFDESVEVCVAGSSVEHMAEWLQRSNLPASTATHCKGAHLHLVVAGSAQAGTSVASYVMVTGYLRPRTPRPWWAGHPELGSGLFSAAPPEPAAASSQPCNGE